MPDYQISPYMQERYVWAGQSDVYDKSNDLINKFLRVDTNAMQVHRLTNTYGEICSDLVDVSSVNRLKPTDDSEVVYAQLDGSMVLTRENDWQEIKVGRLFSSGSISATNPQRREITDSIYTAVLGDKDSFTERFETLTDELKYLGSRLVFITDGAVWIKNWIKDKYPQATRILDYYHACEYIGKWCELTDSDKVKRKETATHYRTILLEQGGQALIDLLEKELQVTDKRSATREIDQTKILDYFKGNVYRMDYPIYRQKGLCIGSGAIEAAHRTVVQKRMKLSGQRWTENRVQNMLNLRTAKMSGFWDNVTDIIRTGFRIAG